MVAMLIAIVLISPFVAVIIALTVIAAIFCAQGQKRKRFVFFLATLDHMTEYTTNLIHK